MGFLVKPESAELLDYCDLARRQQDRAYREQLSLPLEESLDVQIFHDIGVGFLQESLVTGRFVASLEAA